MRKLVAWGMVAVVVIGAGVGVLGAKFHWEWGDVPTWVGAVATVTALAAAAFGAYFAYGQLGILRDQAKLQDKALRLQMDQLKSDREEASRRAEQELRLLQVAARRQAEQVIVKPTMRHVYFENAPYNMVLAISVDNRSLRPIRNVAARMDMQPYSRRPYGYCDSTLTKASASIHRPPLPGLLIRSGESADLVFPASKLESRNGFDTYTLWHIGPDNHIADPPLPGDEMVGPKFSYVIRFTDDALQHWELTDDMQLTQIADRSDW